TQGQGGVWQVTAVHRSKSGPLLSALGLGCAKTPALALHVEISRSNCISESQIILHTPGSMPCWRIVFSTFRGCMSFYTARVKSGHTVVVSQFGLCSLYPQKRTS